MRKDWQYKKLNEVCEKGSSNLVISKLEDNHGDYPLYGASGIVKGVDFYQQDKPYIGIVKDGAGVGRVNVYPGKSSLVGTMQYIFPKDGYDIEYIKFFLEKLDLSKHVTGATIPHIYFKDYGKEEIPVPPLTTQQRIVTELNKISNLIELKRKELEIYNKLSQSLFYEMFGDPIDNEKGWSMKKLGEIYKVSSSKRIMQEDWKESGVPFLKVSDIVAMIEERSFVPSTFISEDIYADLLRNGFVPSPNDILVTSRGTLGLCYIVNEKDRFYFQDGMVTWLSNNKEGNNPIYITYLFKNEHFLQQITDKANKSTVAYISITQLSKRNIPVPPIELQEQFAERITAIEKQKKHVKAAIEKLIALLNSRMDFWYTIDRVTNDIININDAEDMIKERYYKRTKDMDILDNSLSVRQSNAHDIRRNVQDIEFNVLAEIYLLLQDKGHLTKSEINNHFSYRSNGVFEYVCVLVELELLMTDDYEIFQIC